MDNLRPAQLSGTLGPRAARGNGIPESQHRDPHDSFDPVEVPGVETLRLARGQANHAVAPSARTLLKIAQAALKGGLLSALPVVGCVATGLSAAKLGDHGSAADWPKFLAGIGLNLGCSVAAFFVGPLALLPSAAMGAYGSGRHAYRESIPSPVAHGAERRAQPVAGESPSIEAGCVEKPVPPNPNRPNPDELVKISFELAPNLTIGQQIGLCTFHLKTVTLSEQGAIRSPVGSLANFASCCERARDLIAAGEDRPMGRAVTENYLDHCDNANDRKLLQDAAQLWFKKSEFPTAT